jgi:hypothetical protein
MEVDDSRVQRISPRRTTAGVGARVQEEDRTVEEPQASELNPSAVSIDRERGEESQPKDDLENSMWAVDEEILAEEERLLITCFVHD